ncbi:LysR family transcriptional regulator [Ochrobactrum sp. BTU1]|uniref:LysR family transcriptional regulator n=1 Tax=Ochrobactrum sp. BTU1 TaxID=2840456 RepID=UPI001C056680|nr:LysR family transcriptional regulator [Ochrobactrum sp. BTU1]
MRQRHIPPLPSLRAFEATARLGSFTAAAAELHVTQSAISQAVRQLEQQVGRRLFDRVGGMVQLTPEARRFGSRLGSLLDELLEATNAVAIEETPLMVACARSHLNYWLLPRLSDFRKFRPDISVEVVGTDRGEGYATADIVIVTAPVAAPPFDAEPLWKDRLVMVASPQIAQEAINAGASFGNIPKIGTFGTDWSRWFAEEPTSASSGTAVSLRLRETSAVVRAATEGLGIALVSEFLASGELKAGRLVLLSEKRLLRDHGVWLQVRLKTLSMNATAFAQWLREEARLQSSALPQL